MFTLYRTPALLQRLFPNLLWRVPTKEKIIYLTFDDGPVPGPTEFVLELLKRFGAQATFFCIGDNIRKYPEIFERIKLNGHRVANHSFNHLKGWSVPDKLYLQNIEQCQHYFPENKHFRPPYGRIKPSQVRQLTNMQIVMWDVLSYDYKQNLPLEAALNGIIKATRPGSIIVFHDSLKAENNLKYLLPKYMEYFANDGFLFQSLGETQK